jgi:hypothetical protein
MKKWAKRVFLSLLAVFCGIQFVPVDRTNPIVNSANTLCAPPEVDGMLRAACYDCHSDETHQPWYGYVAPVSWYLARDVRAGRDRLNFSEWGELAPREQINALGDITSEITTGVMPPPAYLKMHPDARLMPEQIRQLTDWTDATMRGISAVPSTPSK